VFAVTAAITATSATAPSAAAATAAACSMSYEAAIEALRSRPRPLLAAFRRGAVRAPGYEELTLVHTSGEGTHLDGVTLAL
jgi:hypothetical protein